MTTEAAFLRCIIAHRDEDWPRLVFADWLDEHGAGPYAEFIRVQCDLAKIDEAERNPSAPTSLILHQPGAAMQEVRKECVDACLVLSHRESALLRGGVGAALRESLGRSLVAVWTQYNCTARERSIDGTGVARRGFIADMTLPAADWERHASQILAATPLETVKLTTWPKAISFWSTPSEREQFLEWAKRWPTLKIEMPTVHGVWIATQRRLAAEVERAYGLPEGSLTSRLESRRRTRVAT